MHIMRVAGEAAMNAFPRALLTAALLFWLTATGCNNTCVSFSSNPPTGTLVIKVNDAKPTCTLSRANGAVRLHLGSSPMSSTGSGPLSIRHIFVSLQGIEAHPSAIADDDSPDWQELAPKLALQPLQVDLMAQAADSCTPGPFDAAIVPAGAYRQICLRLVPNEPATSEPVLEENACGRVGFHCVVTADGVIRPLALAGAARELRITSEQLADGFFLILPDVGTDLAIAFNAYSWLALPAGEAALLVPLLTAARQPTCQSRGPER